MQLLSIGAFPFPYPQGSQVFAAEQARALADAGAEVTLLTYGSGEGEPETGEGVDWAPSSRVLAPRRLRSGPSLAKPAADLALVASAVRLQRARSFDVALAHNVEAVFVAALTRWITGLPFVYVAHTLLENELPTYASGQGRWLAGLGAHLDRRAARSADAVLALGECAGRALGAHARGPLEVIPPGLTCGLPPSEAEQQRICERHGLVPRRFFLYAGNLDRYQGLDRLRRAAQLLPADGPPLVLATHDAGSADLSTNPGANLGTDSAANGLADPPAGASAPASRRVRSIEVANFDELRPLLFSALALVAPRRVAGGFAIKLLNYMEAGRPIVAYEGGAEGLDSSSAVLLPDETGPEELALALSQLAAESTRADQLGRTARARCLAVHAWPELAERTLALARLASGPD